MNYIDLLSGNIDISSDITQSTKKLALQSAKENIINYKQKRATKFVNLITSSSQKSNKKRNFRVGLNTKIVRSQKIDVNTLANKMIQTSDNFLIAFSYLHFKENMDIETILSNFLKYIEDLFQNPRVGKNISTSKISNFIQKKLSLKNGIKNFTPKSSPFHSIKDISNNMKEDINKIFNTYNNIPVDSENQENKISNTTSQNTTSQLFKEKLNLINTYASILAGESYIKFLNYLLASKNIDDNLEEYYSYKKSIFLKKYDKDNKIATFLYANEFTGETEEMKVENCNLDIESINYPEKSNNDLMKIFQEKKLENLNISSDSLSEIQKGFEQFSEISDEMSNYIASEFTLGKEYIESVNNRFKDLKFTSMPSILKNQDFKDEKNIITMFDTCLLGEYVKVEDSIYLKSTGNKISNLPKTIQEQIQNIKENYKDDIKKDKEYRSLLIKKYEESARVIEDEKRYMYLKIDDVDEEIIFNNNEQKEFVNLKNFAKIDENRYYLYEDEKNIENGVLRNDKEFPPELRKKFTTNYDITKNLSQENKIFLEKLRDQNIENKKPNLEKFLKTTSKIIKSQINKDYLTKGVGNLDKYNFFYKIKDDLYYLFNDNMYQGVISDTVVSQKQKEPDIDQFENALFDLQIDHLQPDIAYSQAINNFTNDNLAEMYDEANKNIIRDKKNIRSSYRYFNYIEIDDDLYYLYEEDEQGRIFNVTEDELKGYNLTEKTLADLEENIDDVKNLQFVLSKYDISDAQLTTNFAIDLEKNLEYIVNNLTVDAINTDNYLEEIQKPFLNSETLKTYVKIEAVPTNDIYYVYDDNDGIFASIDDDVMEFKYGKRENVDDLKKNKDQMYKLLKTVEKYNEKYAENEAWKKNTSFYADISYNNIINNSVTDSSELNSGLNTVEIIDGNVNSIDISDKIRKVYETLKLQNISYIERYVLYLNGYYNIKEEKFQNIVENEEKIKKLLNQEVKFSFPQEKVSFNKFNENTYKYIDVYNNNDNKDNIDKELDEKFKHNLNTEIQYKINDQMNLARVLRKVTLENGKIVYVNRHDNTYIGEFKDDILSKLDFEEYTWSGTFTIEKGKLKGSKADEWSRDGFSRSFYTLNEIDSLNIEDNNDDIHYLNENEEKQILIVDKKNNNKRTFLDLKNMKVSLSGYEENYVYQSATKIRNIDSVKLILDENEEYKQIDNKKIDEISMTIYDIENEYKEYKTRIEVEVKIGKTIMKFEDQSDKTLKSITSSTSSNFDLFKSLINTYKFKSYTTIPTNKDNIIKRKYFGIRENDNKIAIVDRTYFKYENFNSIQDSIRDDIDNRFPSLNNSDIEKLKNNMFDTLKIYRMQNFTLLGKLYEKYREGKFNDNGIYDTIDEIMTQTNENLRQEYIQHPSKLTDLLKKYNISEEVLGVDYEYHTHQKIDYQEEVNKIREELIVKIVMNGPIDEEKNYFDRNLLNIIDEDNIYKNSQRYNKLYNIQVYEYSPIMVGATTQQVLYHQNILSVNLNKELKDDNMDKRYVINENGNVFEIYKTKNVFNENVWKKMPVDVMEKRDELFLRSLAKDDNNSLTYYQKLEEFRSAWKEMYEDSMDEILDEYDFEPNSDDATKFQNTLDVYSKITINELSILYGISENDVLGIGESTEDVEFTKRDEKFVKEIREKFFNWYMEEKKVRVNLINMDKINKKFEDYTLSKFNETKQGRLLQQKREARKSTLKPVDQFEISNNLLSKIKTKLSDDSIDKETLKNYLEMEHSLDEILEAAEFEKKYEIYKFRYPNGYGNPSAPPLSFEEGTNNAVTPSAPPSPFEEEDIRPSAPPSSFEDEDIRPSAPELPDNNIPVAEAVEVDIFDSFDSVGFGSIPNDYYYEIDRSKIDTETKQYKMKEVDINTMISDNLEDLSVGETLIRENRKKYGSLIDMFKMTKAETLAIASSDVIQDDVVSLYSSNTFDIPPFEKIYLEEKNIIEYLQPDEDKMRTEFEQLEKRVELYNNYFGRKKMRSINRSFKSFKSSKNLEKTQYGERLNELNGNLDMLKDKMNIENENDFEKKMDIKYRFRILKKNFKFYKFDDISIESGDPAFILDKILKDVVKNDNINRRKKLISQFLAVYYSEMNKDMFNDKPDKFEFIYNIWKEESLNKKERSKLPSIKDIKDKYSRKEADTLFSMNYKTNKETKLLKVFKNYHDQMSNFENNKYKEKTSRDYYELEINKQIDTEEKEKNKKFKMLKDSQIIKRVENHRIETYNTITMKNIESFYIPVKMEVVNVEGYGSTFKLFHNLSSNDIPYSEWLSLQYTQEYITENHGLIDVPIVEGRSWMSYYNTLTKEAKEIYLQYEIDPDNFIFSEGKGMTIKARFNKDNEKIIEKAKKFHENNEISSLNSHLSKNEEVINSRSIFKKLLPGQVIQVDEMFFMINTNNKLIKVTKNIYDKMTEEYISGFKTVPGVKDIINSRFDILLNDDEVSYLMDKFDAEKLSFCLFNDHLINKFLNEYLDKKLNTPTKQENITLKNEEISRLTKSFNKVELKKTIQIREIEKTNASMVSVNNTLYNLKNKEPRATMKTVLDKWVEKLDPTKRTKTMKFLEDNNFYLTKENLSTRTIELRGKWNEFKKKNKINVDDPPFPRQYLDLDSNNTVSRAANNVTNYADNFLESLDTDSVEVAGALLMSALGTLAIFGIVLMTREDNATTYNTETGERIKSDTDSNPLNIEQMTNFCERISSNGEGKKYEYDIKYGGQYQRRHTNEGELLAQDPKRRCTANDESNTNLLKNKSICHQTCTEVTDLETQFTSQFSESVTDTCLDKYNIPRGKHKISDIVRMTGKSLNELTKECPIEKILAFYVDGLTEEEYENQNIENF